MIFRIVHLPHDDSDNLQHHHDHHHQSSSSSSRLLAGKFLLSASRLRPTWEHHVRLKQQGNLSCTYKQCTMYIECTYVYRIYYRPWKMSALTCTLLHENTTCVSCSRAARHVHTWLYRYSVFLVVMIIIITWWWWWQWWPDDDHRQRPDHKQSDHCGSRRKGRHHGPLGTPHTWGGTQWACAMQW